MEERNKPARKMKCKRRSYCKVVAGGILLFSGLLPFSCSRPKEVLSEKEMIELIADLKLAEAYSNSQSGSSNPVERREELAKSVLAAHNVTQEQLDTTLGWYGRNLDKYSELYEKVDKRLLEKRKRLLSDDASTIQKEGDNLWIYEKNGVISTLGNSDGWIISIAEPELTGGDRVEWSMHLKTVSTPLVGVLGVDYEDGTGEAVTSYFTNRQHIDLSLQTDTGKVISRLYGSMRLKKTETDPLFVDSIALRRMPYDSIEYVRFRSQKRYGYPVRITQEDRKRKATADSLRQDSIRKASELRRDSIRRESELHRDTINKRNNSSTPEKFQRPEQRKLLRQSSSPKKVNTTVTKR